jgi:hypothetical protein
MVENIIYDKNISDYSNYTNLLLIDAQIHESDLFYSCVNSNTYPIKYNIISKIDSDKKVYKNIIDDTKSDIFEVDEIYNSDNDFKINYNMEDLKNSFDIDKIYNSDADFEINYNMKDINYNMKYINSTSQTSKFISENNFTDDLINELEQYNKFTQKQQITKLLELNNFVNLKRICIVCDDLNITNNKIFFDSEPFFTKDDLDSNQTIYSENLQFLIDLCKVCD